MKDYKNWGRETEFTMGEKVLFWTVFFVFVFWFIDSLLVGIKRTFGA